LCHARSGPRGWAVFKEHCLPIRLASTGKGQRERAPVPHEGGCREEEAAEEADRPAMDAIPDEATEPSSAFPHRLSATQSGVSIVRRLPLSHLGPRAGTEPSSDPTAACLAAVYKRLVEHSLLSAVTGKGK